MNSWKFVREEKSSTVPSAGGIWREVSCCERRRAGQTRSATDHFNDEFAKDCNSPQESSSLLECNMKNYESQESSHSEGWISDLLDNLAPVL